MAGLIKDYDKALDAEAARLKDPPPMTNEEFDLKFSLRGAIDGLQILEAFRAEKVRGDAAEEKIDQIERRRVNAEVASDRRLAVAEARIAELEARLAAAPSVPEDLRKASEAATHGAAYTCGLPWYQNASGVMVGSPDPHSGFMIADTDPPWDALDEERARPDENAAYIAASWNFVRSLIAAQPAHAKP